MKGQSYFSIALVILSFIAVKQIQKVGLDYYHYVELSTPELNGFYSLNSPEKVSFLPFELREISGLTDLTMKEIACVNDEAGTLFIYNLLKDSITSQFHFGNKGDFEGLTRVGSTFYALRSDAALFKITPPYDSLSVSVKQLNLPTWDHEGLCFDERENRLLLAPKSKLGKGPEHKDLRVIYAINLTTLDVSKEPLLSIRVSEIENYAKSKNLRLPMRLNKQSGDSASALKFLPSSLAVHPITDELYIISAVDKSMAVYTKSGELKNYQLLDPILFNQPEGITFLEDGTMIITNEGQMGHSTLLRFTWNTSAPNSGNTNK
jgi:uncharacterized protein YjiK